ncbi:MAG: (2Fe-2S) ferredoxin domain-containing protein [Rhodospirillaceae bacterium]|nr:(2Fe-2S) ferredoxin domain-containing protein [Rhodospirillaceae bacterium]
MLPQNNLAFSDLLEPGMPTPHLSSMSKNSPKNPPAAKIYAKIYVCTNFRAGVHSSCAERGSKQIFKQLCSLASERSPKIGKEIIVEQIVCLGQCERGPNVRIAGKEIINGVRGEDLGAIVDSAVSTIDSSNDID